ncbi:MAG: hypothetical protein QOE52_1307 [Mycobacterium sp.]|jgi:hypothetical protein|nr:hypothetical protein [Mycobacterium sp.]MDT7740883.1 hypothetical protein [Mycobacterium sp.]
MSPVSSESLHSGGEPLIGALRTDAASLRRARQFDDLAARCAVAIWPRLSIRNETNRLGA